MFVADAQSQFFHGQTKVWYWQYEMLWSETTSLPCMVVYLCCICISLTVENEMKMCTKVQIFKWFNLSQTSSQFCLLTPRLYSPLKTLSSLITDAHSSLLTAFWCHLLTFISCRSISTYSSHLSLGLPLLLLLSSLLSKYFLNCPSLIHSYYMSNPFQSLLFNICYYV